MVARRPHPERPTVTAARTDPDLARTRSPGPGRPARRRRSRGAARAVAPAGRGGRGPETPRNVFTASRDGSRPGVRRL